MQEVQENQSTFINCCWSGSRVVGELQREREKKERGPINCIGSWAHACMSAVTLTHSVYSKSGKKKKGNERDHHNGGVPARTEPALRTWKESRAWKEMLYVWSEGRFVEGRGGWRTASGDQWKSWGLTCHTCEKDLLAIEEVLKAAFKVAAGEKYPTLCFTIHCHQFVKIQKLQRSWRVISYNSATNGSSYMLYISPDACDI